MEVDTLSPPFSHMTADEPEIEATLERPGKVPDDIPVDEPGQEAEQPPADAAPEIKADEDPTMRERLRKAAERVDALIENIDPQMRRVREQRLQGLAGTDYEQFDRIYRQMPLSFHGTLRLNKLVSGWLREMTTGDDAVSLDSLLSVDSIAKAFIMTAEKAPDLVDQFYLLVLNVPRAEHEVVLEVLGQPCDEETGRGGLTFEDGLAIVDTFLAQNAKVVSDFFHKSETRVSLVAQVGQVLRSLVSPTSLRES